MNCLTNEESSNLNPTLEAWKLFLRKIGQSYVDFFHWFKNLIVPSISKARLGAFSSSVFRTYVDFFLWLQRFFLHQRGTSDVLKVMLNIETLSAYFNNLRPTPISTQIIESAHPFHLDGDTEYGILLVHGFCSNPSEMRELAGLLNRKGFTVEAILLKGHGTSVRDLSTTEFVDWYESVLNGYDKLSSECSKIFVLGHSIGGTLSLLLAANRKVEAIISFCAPIDLGKFYHGLPIPLLPYLSKFVSKWPKPKKYTKLHDDAGIEAYRSSSLPGVVELFNLMEVTREELNKVEAPLLIVGASHDFNVPLSNMSLLEQVVKSKKVETFTATKSGHTVLFDADKEKIFQKVLTFLESVMHEKKYKNTTSDEK